MRSPCCCQQALRRCAIAKRDGAATPEAAHLKPCTARCKPGARRQPAHLARHQVIAGRHARSSDGTCQLPLSCALQPPPVSSLSVMPHAPGLLDLSHTEAGLAARGAPEIAIATSSNMGVSVLGCPLWRQGAVVAKALVRVRARGRLGLCGASNCRGACVRS
eukprot:scaffold13553_cov80-Phaeocystis_antarctica.AAC.6